MILMWENTPVMNIEFFKDGKVKSVGEVYSKNHTPLGFLYQDKDHTTEFVSNWWKKIAFLLKETTCV